MNYNIKGCGVNKLSVLLLVSMWLMVGCASTPPEPKQQVEPTRTDLYQGFSPITHSQNQAPKNEQQAIERAQQAEKLHKLDKAIYSYIQALEFNPINANTLYQIAKLHAIKGNSSLALKVYQEALVINPDMVGVHSELGIYAFNQRKYNLARTHLIKALELDQTRLGNTVLDIDPSSLKALDQKSPLRAYNALAILADLDGDHLKASDYFRLALKQQPNSALLTTNIGYSLYLNGNYDVAEHYFKQAIKLSPKFERAWTNLGLVYAKKGQYQQALDTFNQVMPPAQALNDLGYFMLLAHQYAKAIELFNQAIDTSPSYFEQANQNLKRAISGYQRASE